MNQKTSSNHSSQAFGQHDHANFIEALKSIGGQTAKAITHDVAGNVGRDFIQSLTGNPKTERELTPEEQINDEIARLSRHREITETNVFNRKEEETKTKVKVIQEELKALAQELAGMDAQLEKAIEAEIVNPGTYHISFFEKLRRILINLRKSVVESANWLELSNQRKAAQRGYWGNVGKSGTKFLLSQERTVATQSG